LVPNLPETSTDISQFDIVYQGIDMILVTGASGLIGGNLVRQLIQTENSIRVFTHRDKQALSGLDVEAFSGDIRDPGQVKKAMQGIDIVFHLAAEISLKLNTRKQMEEINVLGTKNVVDACLKSGVKRLIHFSSIHAFSQEPLMEVLDETRSLVVNSDRLEKVNSISPYDRSKALGELEVKRGIRQGLDAVIIAPTAVVGPLDYKPSYMGQALVLMARGRLPALVTGGFDWVDVRDVITGALKAQKYASCGSKFLLGGHWHSVSDVADIVYRITGQKPPWLTVPRQLAVLGLPFVSLIANLKGEEPLYTEISLQALNSNKHISHVKAERELGYSARPLEETIRDTLSWFEKKGYL
jgi:dihydroflavonol-4-reductase